MIRTTVLALGTVAGLALSSGTASAQLFAPPGYNYSYAPTTIVTPVGGYVTGPFSTGYYAAPRYPAYGNGYRTGFYGGTGYRSYGNRGGYGYSSGYRGGNVGGRGFRR